MDQMEQEEVLLPVSMHQSLPIQKLSDDNALYAMNMDEDDDDGHDGGVNENGVMQMQEDAIQNALYGVYSSESLSQHKSLSHQEKVDQSNHEELMKLGQLGLEMEMELEPKEEGEGEGEGEGEEKLDPREHKGQKQIDEQKQYREEFNHNAKGNDNDDHDQQPQDSNKTEDTAVTAHTTVHITGNNLNLDKDDINTEDARDADGGDVLVGDRDRDSGNDNANVMKEQHGDGDNGNDNDSPNDDNDTGDNDRMSSMSESIPFHHPSSPISVNHNNDSLTHENLELLDQSLSLTDNGKSTTMDRSMDKNVNMLMEGVAAKLGLEVDGADPARNGQEGRGEGGGSGENDNYTINGNREGATTAAAATAYDYVSFPSSTRTHSRANSIISSATTTHTNHTSATSTTNNTATAKRRRPRPWDYNVNANSNSNANANANNNPNNINMDANGNMNKETTPLLPPRPTSVFSAKTERRDNTHHHHNQYHKRAYNQYDPDNIMIDSDQLLQAQVQVQVPSSPTLKWDGGVFREQQQQGKLFDGDAIGSKQRFADDQYYGSINNNKNGKNDGDFDIYGNGNGHGNEAGQTPIWGDGGGIMGLFLSSFKKSSNSTPASSSAPVSSFLLYGTTIHFTLMALYNTFLHYQAQRLHAVTNGSLYGEGYTPPYWFSYAGRIYNPMVGPNVPTLILFGALHPVLVLNEWWRMISALFCCTSVVDLCVTLFLLRVMQEEEFMIGSWNLLFCFGICSFMGALSNIMDMSWSVAEDTAAAAAFNTNVYEGDYIYALDSASVTGLGGAGIVGVMCAVLTKQFYINRFMDMNMDLDGAKGNAGKGSSVNAHIRLRVRKLSWLSWRGWGYPQLAIVLQILGGLFLPFKALPSIIGGILMGFACGLFIIGPTIYSRDWYDADSQSSSVASDLEEAFSPGINTPPRYGYDDSPNPPPSSSSKGGLDTPIMRRSILTSPEEDDEFDMMQSLNAPGGLKQRNNKSKSNFSYEDRSLDSHSANGHQQYQYGNRATSSYCTEARLRFIGLICGLLMITISVLYIGIFLNLPSDQAITDSLYGCHTMHSLYTLQQDEGNEMDDGAMNANMAGETVCGEVCIPTSIFGQVMSGVSSSNGGTTLQSGTCSSQEGYSCQYMSNAFDAGFLAIEEELYTQGECSESATNDNSATNQ